MSFFKKWNTKKSHSPSKVIEKENTGVKPKNFAEEDELDLPPSVRRPDRNLSISRSGRHKMRQRQRTSVMSDELYSPQSGQPRQQTQPSHMAWSRDTGSAGHAQSNMQSSNSKGYHCRETIDQTTGHNNLSGSQRMAHAPTAV